jgi:uncharacterized protein (TIGR00251 family)
LDAPFRAFCAFGGAPGFVNSCTLELKVIPHAPRDEIAGWLGGALKVKVRAPALEGRANDALLDFLARELRLPRRALTLVRGEKSRHKAVRLAGVTLAQVKACLPAATT